jgi:hypothetical protein
VPAHTARRGNRQSPTQRHQREKSVGAARVFDDYDPFADGQKRKGFVRIVVAILHIGRAAHNLIQRIQHMHVVVIGGRAQRIGPEQVHSGQAAARHDRVVRHTAEVVQPRRPGDSRRPSILEIAFPRARSAFELAAAVAGRRKKQRARRGHVIDGQSNRAVLERRLREVNHVIHNDAAARRMKIPDVLRETGDTAKRGRKVQLRAGRQVVNDLQHGRALSIADSGLARQNRHVRQFPRRLRLSKVVHAV